MEQLSISRNHGLWHRERIGRILQLLAGLLLSFHVGNAQPFSWEPAAGPYGGRISALAVGGDDQLFAATGFGGVFRSTDHGSSWHRADNGLGSEPIQSIAIAPSGSIFATSFPR